MTLTPPPRGARMLLPAEQGTRVLCGGAYHWDRQLRVDLRNARTHEVLVLCRGRDPEEKGPCGKVLLRSDDGAVAVRHAQCRRPIGHEGLHRDDIKGVEWFAS